MIQECEPMTGIEPVTPSLPRKYSTPELHRLEKRGEIHNEFHLSSGRPGSNRPPSAWKADALPNELLPLILFSKPMRFIKDDAPKLGLFLRIQFFESLFYWWGEKDSNLRTPKRTDLQSGAVGHLAISPTS